jgi:uncharacterized membrane protein
LVLKGFNAAFELVVGGLLLILPPETIRAWTEAVTGFIRSVLHQAGHGHLAGMLETISMETMIFIAWYFISHGVVKAFVVVCLLARKMWAYPLGIVVFVGFGIYQTWEYFHGGGNFYMVLNVLDVALIGLTAMEWRHALRTGMPSVDKRREIEDS